MLQDLLNHLRNHNPHYRIDKIKVSLIVAWEYTVSGIIPPLPQIKEFPKSFHFRYVNIQEIIAMIFAFVYLGLKIMLRYIFFFQTFPFLITIWKMLGELK